MEINIIHFRRGLISICIIIALLGLYNIFNIPIPGEVESKVSDVKTDIVNYNDCPSSYSSPTLSTRAVLTKIPGYLELWDNYNDKPHDGIYGDGDPGDNNKFYLDGEYNFFSIYLHNIYNGDHLEDVNTTIQPASGVTNIISVTSMFYNWSYMDASGYSSVREFFYRFKTTSSATIKAYQLVLSIEFKSFDSNGKYVIRSGKINLEIQLSTRIMTSDGELLLKGRDKGGNSMPIYSGAKNQLVELRDAYSGDGDLEDVVLNMYSNFNDFTIDETLIVIDEFQTSSYYNDDLVWLMTDLGSNDKEGDKYYGKVDISYNKNGISIKEQAVPIALEITSTPFLNLEGQIDESQIGSKSNDIYNSNIEIYQGATTRTFSLKFKNDGNQKLRNVKVELYTDNAAFFFKSKFYYDEGNDAYKRPYGKTIELGEFSVSQQKTADISTEIIKNLPPGLYKIPIKYTIQYSESELVDIEVDEYDIHDDIVSARSTTKEGFTPFLLVNVLPGDNEFDTAEPDINAISQNTLRPGMHNVKLSVELTNLEYYRLNNVNVDISGGGSSPLLQLNSLERDEVQISCLEKDFTIFSLDDPGYSNKYTVSFMVDVYKDAISGVNEVPITLTCLDPFNQMRTVKVKVPLNINPIPPRIIVIDANTDKIEPDETFNLKITVYNCGGSDASNVKLLFNGSTNMFTADKSVQGPKNINKGAEADFEYKIKAGDIEPGEIYTPSVLIEFEDEFGNVNNFNENPEQFITLRTNKPDPESAWTINVGISLIILGLMILISTILFGILRSRPKRRTNDADKIGRMIGVAGDNVDPRVKGPGFSEKDKIKGKKDRRLKKDEVVFEPDDRNISTTVPTPAPTPVPAAGPQTPPPRSGWDSSTHAYAPAHGPAHAHGVPTQTPPPRGDRPVVPGGRRGQQPYYDYDQDQEAYQPQQPHGKRKQYHY